MGEFRFIPQHFLNQVGIHNQEGLVSIEDAARIANAELDRHMKERAVESIFKPEDFMDISPNQYTDVARKANARLAEMLGPEVFGQQNGDWYWGPADDEGRDTHVARLFDVRPIEAKAECEHPIDKIILPSEFCKSYRCANCGKFLKPKWEVAGE